MNRVRPRVAIVDYGLGNLFSVKQACEHAGMTATITSARVDVLAAAAVVLPGVGAYGDAMATLHKLDLVGVLRDVAAAQKPLVGICLGMQLLMTESYEFGRHAGLDIIAGAVVPFDHPVENGRALKVPHVGWNHIDAVRPWDETPLSGITDGARMYFVHSYVVQPHDSGVVVSTSRYGQVEFCSSLRYRNVFACQFHPERSGVEGLRVYANLAHHLSALGDEQ